MLCVAVLGIISNTKYYVIKRCTRIPALLTDVIRLPSNDELIISSLIIRQSPQDLQVRVLDAKAKIELFRNRGISILVNFIAILMNTSGCRGAPGITE